MAPIAELYLNIAAAPRSLAAKQIIAELKGSVGCTLYDYEYRKDDGSFTAIVFGDPASLLPAALNVCLVATQHIDMRIEQETRCLGAVDTVSFIPIEDIGMDDCIALAREFALSAHRILEIPIYYFARSANLPQREERATLREGGYPRLLLEIANEDCRPDLGEARLHPSAGAMLVGARPVYKSDGMNGSDYRTALAVYRSQRAFNRLKNLGSSPESQGPLAYPKAALQAIATFIYSSMELIRIGK